MTVKLVCDSVLGDSGKGKFIHALSSNSNDGGAVVRFIGGGNAGRRIVHDGKEFKVHLFPSGAFCDNMTNVIGPMIAFDPVQLVKEYDGLVENGFNPKFMISDRVKILMPFHKYLNQVEEESLGKGKMGSTRQGITNFYTDLWDKKSLTIQEIYESRDYIKDKLKRCIDMKNVLLEHFYHRDKINLDNSIDEIFEVRDKFKPFIGDVRKFLLDLKEKGKTVIFESHLGSIRDVTIYYPNISSSPSFFSGYAPVSCGLPRDFLDEVLCICKAYGSSVGSGDLPARMETEFEDEFRIKANEFGTTSGSPRKLFYFDCVMVKYGVDVQDPTDLGMTCLDLLSDWDEIPVCIAYEDQRTGEVVKDFPLYHELKYMSPVYEVLSSWQTDISNTTNYDDLPTNAKNYVEFIEKHIGRRIRYISVSKDQRLIDRQSIKYMDGKEVVLSEQFKQKFREEISLKGGIKRDFHDFVGPTIR